MAGQYSLVEIPNNQNLAVLSVTRAISEVKSLWIEFRILIGLVVAPSAECHKVYHMYCRLRLWSIHDQKQKRCKLSWSFARWKVS